MAKSRAQVQQQLIGLGHFVGWAMPTEQGFQVFTDVLTSPFAAITVPYHKGKTVPVGTLRNIMVSANIPEAEWKAE